LPFYPIFVILILTEILLNTVGKTETQLASHVLQFVFLGDNGFRFPIAQFPSHDCSPSDLFMNFWDGVVMMKEAGFT
jgi:hypothetical protein